MSANPNHAAGESSSVTMNNVGYQASTVDVLLPTKPIKEYLEYDCSCIKEAEGIPDYRFEIAHVDQLLLHKTELRGKEFQLPGCNFSAQIQCNVNYDHFQLSIRFLDPPNEGKTMDLRIAPVITTVVNNRNKCYGNSDEKLCYVFPLNTARVYGTFYPFCALSYGKKLKNVIDSFSNSITLHLYVRSVVSNALLVPDGVFLWKVDVSHGRVQHGACFENEKQLAFSPIIYKAENKVILQLRLFLKDLNCYVEVKYCSALRTSDRMLLTVIHPVDSTERIELTFNRGALAEAAVETQPKDPKSLNGTAATQIFVLADIEKLLPYMYNNKLILAVEI